MADVAFALCRLNRLGPTAPAPALSLREASRHRAGAALPHANSVSLAAPWVERRVGPSVRALIEGAYGTGAQCLFTHVGAEAM